MIIEGAYHSKQGGEEEEEVHLFFFTYIFCTQRVQKMSNMGILCTYPSPPNFQTLGRKICSYLAWHNIKRMW